MKFLINNFRGLKIYTEIKIHIKKKNIFAGILEGVVSNF